MCKRIRHARGRHVRRAKERVFLFVDQRNGDNLVIPETNQPLAQPVFGLGMRQSRRRLFCGMQPRREFVQSIMPRDFFDQIHFARDVLAPGRLKAAPSCE